MQKLPPDSTDVYKKSMIDRYMDRPNATFKNGMFKIINNLCFAQFLACYFIDYSPKEPNDCQP